MGGWSVLRRHRRAWAQGAGGRADTIHPPTLQRQGPDCREPSNPPLQSKKRQGTHLGHEHLPNGVVALWRQLHACLGRHLAAGAGRGGRRRLRMRVHRPLRGRIFSPSGACVPLGWPGPSYHAAACVDAYACMHLVPTACAPRQICSIRPHPPDLKKKWGMATRMPAPSPVFSSQPQAPRCVCSEVGRRDSAAVARALASGRGALELAGLAQRSAGQMRRLPPQQSDEKRSKREPTMRKSISSASVTTARRGCLSSSATKPTPQASLSLSGSNKPAAGGTSLCAARTTFWGRRGRQHGLAAKVHRAGGRRGEWKSGFLLPGRLHAGEQWA